MPYPLKKIDVMVNTYNSEKYLEQCLASICENIPVRKLFVIDKFSKDRTLEISEKFGAEVVQSDVSLAEARKLGFNLVETEKFVNVDSDIVLPFDWFNRVMEYWDSDKIGCVWGVPIHMDHLHGMHQTAMYKLRSPESYRIPFLPNMIARKDLLEDIEFPSLMKWGSVAREDYAIRNWIENKGFVCKCAPVYCEHYASPPLINVKTFWGGAGLRLEGRNNLLWLLRGVCLSIPQSLFTSYVNRNAHLIPYWIKFRFQELYGFLHWNKYYDLKRR